MPQYTPLQRNSDGTYTPLPIPSILSNLYVDEVGNTKLEEIILKKYVYSNQVINGFTYNSESNYYEYVYSNENIHENSSVTINLSDIESYDISVECGLLPVSTEGEGTITMYAIEMPSGPMNMDIIVIN